MHFKTLSVRNSDNIIYKTQKPSYKNQNLKSTDLRQIQRLIQSSSISTALVPHSFRFFQVHWLYNRNIILVISTVPIEIMLLSLEKNTHTHTHREQNKQKQQQHIIALVYITGGDAIRKLLWMINRQDLHPLPYCHHS